MEILGSDKMNLYSLINIATNFTLPETELYNLVNLLSKTFTVFLNSEVKYCKYNKVGKTSQYKITIEDNLPY
jgi:hypothetical protein